MDFSAVSRGNHTATTVLYIFFYFYLHYLYNLIYFLNLIQFNLFFFRAHYINSQVEISVGTTRKLSPRKLSFQSFRDWNSVLCVICVPAHHRDRRIFIFRFGRFGNKEHVSMRCLREPCNLLLRSGGTVVTGLQLT